MAKGGLGKGLNAFFSNVEVAKDEFIREINIAECRPNPYQPRKIFEQEAIEELKQSIEEYGILQPLIVRKTIKGYEIVVGERRFRAAKEAKLDTVPVVIRELTEQQMMEIAVLENLQREDLTPIEEATAYQMLMGKLKITQEELSKRLGKSRPHIANHVRLLSLPAKIQELITEGKISMGHGRALLGLRKKESITKVVEHVSRETKKPVPEKDIFIKEQESSLCERFGTKVQIKQTKDKGKIEIEFFSKEDLERILDMLDTKQEL